MSGSVPPVALVPTRSHRIAAVLLADRHSVPLSIALHLAPGVLVVAVYLLVTERLVLAAGYPAFLGWAVALSVVLLPAEFGLLLWLGRHRTGRLSFRGVVGYLDRSTSRGALAAIVAVLIVQMIVVSFALATLDDLLFRSLFSWVPFEGAGGNATTYLDGFSRSVITVTLAVSLPLTGVALPLIEELYFRGFLLPRMRSLGRGAPIANTVLFSIYHLWSPWAVVSRIVFMFPAIWLVWRKRDIRFSIGMHVGTTLLLGTAGVVVASLGLLS